MKLNKLLKYFLVFLVLAIFFKLQYSDNTGIYSIQKEYNAGKFQPHSPFDNAPFNKVPDSAKDLIRFEFFLIFLFFLTRFAFNFNIFQFTALRIWIPSQEIPLYHVLKRIRNRAPPF